MVQEDKRFIHEEGSLLENIYIYVSNQESHVSRVDFAYSVAQAVGVRSRALAKGEQKHKRIIAQTQPPMTLCHGLIAHLGERPYGRGPWRDLPNQ